MTQVQLSPFDKISSSALIVAYARQFTDIPYSKEFSQMSGAPVMIDHINKTASPVPQELPVLIEGRYKAIDHVMAQFSSTQILEIASGLLPRGMLMSQNPDNVFIESDLPVMISHKRHMVKHLIGDRPNLHFLPIDATSQPTQFPLHVDFLDSHQPVTVVCEGLLPYLTFEQKQQVCDNLREFLEIYGGVWITADFLSKSDFSRLRRVSPFWQKSLEELIVLTGQSAEDLIFEDLAHIETFVKQQGFKLQKYYVLDVFDQLTCLRSLPIAHNIAEFILSDSYIFALTL